MVQKTTTEVAELKASIASAEAFQAPGDPKDERLPPGSLVRQVGIIQVEKEWFEYSFALVLHVNFPTKLLFQRVSISWRQTCMICNFIAISSFCPQWRWCFQRFFSGYRVKPPIEAEKKSELASAADSLLKAQQEAGRQPTRGYVTSNMSCWIFFCSRSRGSTGWTSVLCLKIGNASTSSFVKIYTGTFTCWKYYNANARCWTIRWWHEHDCHSCLHACFRDQDLQMAKQQRMSEKESHESARRCFSAKCHASPKTGRFSFMYCYLRYLGSDDLPYKENLNLANQRCGCGSNVRSICGCPYPMVVFFERRTIGCLQGHSCPDPKSSGVDLRFSGVLITWKQASFVPLIATSQETFIKSSRKLKLDCKRCKQCPLVEVLFLQRR